MKNNYWERRAAQNMVEYNDQAEQTADEIKQLYDRASRHVQIEAEKIFTKYQEQYHLSYRQARNLLNRIHDPTDMKAIIEQLKKDPNNEELAKQLESQAYGARLQRLANLQAQIDSIMLSIFAEEQRRSRQLYINLAEEAYYKAIFDLQQYTGYGFEFKTLSRKNIERILNTKWYGGNFSEHVWGNTEQLAERLKQELILNMLTGRPLRRANLAIEKRFQTGYHNARRLVRTESTYISSQLHKEAYESCGVKKYIYVAILDLKTSEICKSLDKKSFLLSKAIAGINFPPMHPFCRSTIIAWVPLSLLAKMKQSAIDPATGKRITVPGDMTYQQWHEKYVKGKNSPATFIEKESMSNKQLKAAEDVKNMAKECDDIVNKYVRGKSKWSGEVDILDGSEGYSAAKEWSCNISTLLEIEKHQMIHEHLHARSISHYDVETYKNYALMEELPIEFLAREICEKENIKIVYSKAYDNIKYLRKINELVKIETDDFSFAKALFEIPVKERYGWIENQIYSKADNLGIVDFSKAIEWLEKVNSYG